MILHLENIFKSFVQGAREVSVLKGIELAFQEKQILAIMGKSGAGKSTLLSVMAGLEAPDQGSVSLCGHDLTQLNEDEITRLRGEKMGIVFQNFHLLPHLNALENVALPLEIQGREKATEQAREWLNLVGLGHREDHLPGQLSGGEQQRVAVARAVVGQPQLLLADEPSGSLDEGTGTKVIDLLFEVVEKSGCGLILVTHDQDLAQRCDSTMHLDHGKLHELS